MIWNVRKIEYIDGTMEVRASSSVVVAGRSRKKSGNCPDGCEKLEIPLSTPFGAARYEMLDGVDLERYNRQRERDALRSKAESVRRARESVEIIGRANKWDYFLTLTFKNDLCGYSYDDAAAAFKSWLDSLRKRYPSVRYLLVLEQGKKGRWHGHALMSGADLRLEDSGHKTKQHDVIYNMPLEYSLGFTTVTRVRSSAAAGRYISKYIGKSLGDVPSGKKRYWASKDLKRLADICTDYLFDRDDLNSLLAYLNEVSDRVHTCFVRAINRTITYFVVYGSELGSSGVPPT